MNIPLVLKFKKYIKKALTRRKELESFSLDGVQFNVVDYSYWFGIWPSTRTIEHDEGKRFSSVIYLNSKNGHPYLPPVQAMIKAWAGWHEYHHALVLGCAGCAIPRFLFDEYESCFITGVEHSDKMIEIARKFFLHGIDGRFQLVQGDAFDYVSSYQGEGYDLIVVDLFHGKGLVMRIFTDDFMSNLKRICSDTGLVIFNLSSYLSQEELDEYKTAIKHFFPEASLMSWHYSRFIALFPGKVGHDVVGSFKKKTQAYLRK